MRHLIWNVDPAIFILGPIEIRWYGLFFALGFFIGFQIMAQFYRREQRELENLSELLSVSDARYDHRREARSRLALSA